MGCALLCARRRSDCCPPREVRAPHARRGLSRLRCALLPDHATPDAGESHVEAGHLEGQGGEDIRRTKKMLALAGGGIRGILPAMMLAELERRAPQPVGALFDLLAGTSTGGILALGLTVPGEPGETPPPACRAAPPTGLGRAPAAARRQRRPARTPAPAPRAPRPGARPARRRAPPRRHARSEPRQRITGALAHPQRAGAGPQRGGVQGGFLARQMVMALGLGDLLYRPHGAAVQIHQAALRCGMRNDHAAAAPLPRRVRPGARCRRAHAQPLRQRQGNTAWCR